MSTNYDQIMVFGEVLFDVFPDGSRVMGGAPFNVACHLRGFGLDPLFISRIGRDDPGREVVRQMHSRSLSVSGLEMDDHKMTGQVRVTIDNNEPAYEILPDTAYDHIQLHGGDLKESKGHTLLYHGTLAARNRVSAAALYRLARQDNTSVFCDVNLRDPWWEKELIRDILGWCTYLKVNEDEFRQVASLEGVDLSAGLERAAQELRRKRNLKCLIVTLGSKGAMLFPEDMEHIFAASPGVSAFQDSVGAGDAFSSVFMLGIIRSWSWRRILDQAVYFAARICENKGAVPEDRDFYKQAGLAREQDSG